MITLRPGVCVNYQNDGSVIITEPSKPDIIHAAGCTEAILCRLPEQRRGSRVALLRAVHLAIEAQDDEAAYLLTVRLVKVIRLAGHLS